MDSEGWSRISIVERHNAGKAYPWSTNLLRARETIGLGRQFLVVASRWVVGLGVLKADIVIVANFVTVHSKNEGMKHIPTQYDSHTFSFHTMGTKEAFILL